MPNQQRWTGFIFISSKNLAYQWKMESNPVCSRISLTVSFSSYIRTVSILKKKKIPERHSAPLVFFRNSDFNFYLAPIQKPNRYISWCMYHKLLQKHARQLRHFRLQRSVRSHRNHEPRQVSLQGVTLGRHPLPTWKVIITARRKRNCNSTVFIV